MSLTSQSSIFGIALQVNGLKGGAAGPWYRFKTLAANGGPVLNEQMSPPEMGGNNNPTGMYLSSAGYNVNASLQPRLEGDFETVVPRHGGTGCVTEEFVFRFVQNLQHTHIVEHVVDERADDPVAAAAGERGPEVGPVVGIGFLCLRLER